MEKNYLLIPESDWGKHGVRPWDKADHEDGYRTCPACNGESSELLQYCPTCDNSGEVQWTNRGAL